jgi:CRISPR-associated protein Cas5/CasD subtype I-E
MGVRVDRSGIPDWDYHTAGAKFGIRSADGEIKRTASTGEYETLLSRRQYLYDASFLVALQGDTKTIEEFAGFLDNPAWPLFLGRKCCIPTESVFAGNGNFSTLTEALSSIPWHPRISAIDGGHNTKITLDTYMEHQPEIPPPKDARIVYDVPVAFGFYSYKPRWIVKSQVKVAVGAATQIQPSNHRHGNPYSEHFYKVARPSRLKFDNGLCVFCKSPAVEVHHVSYENAGHETDSDLRSLCELCHSACTMLEYSHGRKARVDPCDPAQRRTILDQVESIIKERRAGRRRQLLNAVRGQSED